MEIRKGIGVSPGYAVDKVFVIDTERFFIPRRVLAANKVKAEIERFVAAVAAAREEIVEVQKKFSASVDDETASIFDAHMWMIEDRKIHDEITRRIKEDRVTAEYAVSRTYRRYAKLFSEMKEGYLQQRASDVLDNETRLLRHLLGRQRQTLEALESEVILVSRDLTPSQTALLDPSHVVGIVTDLGGPTSHTAIMAKALKIPCVVGLKDISTNVSGGDILAIDGSRGVVILGPDDSTTASYRTKGTRYREFEDALAAETLDWEPVTAGGVAVEMLVNIEDPSELEGSGTRAGGVGLFRTEFLSMNRDRPLDEVAHYEAYTRCLKALEGMPLVIRTLDLGGDKTIDFSAEATIERNPILGCRSIRLSFEQPAVFRTQVRAALRAAVHGPLKIMFPLVSSIEEIRRARQFVEDVIEELDEEKVEFNREVPLGMMVEVPSAAILIDRFVDEADFFSIGSNDLVQYTLAVDRTNERVANLYRPCHPAVLRLIRDVIKTCNAADKPVTLCGEMAGDLRFTELLLGLGLRSFSMLPVAVPEIKKMIRSLRLDEARTLAESMLELDDSQQIFQILESRAQQILPLSF